MERRREDVIARRLGFEGVSIVQAGGIILWRNRIVLRRTLLGEWSRNALNLRIRGVYIVHTLGFGLRRMWADSGRIPHVSVGVQCLRGRECSSSPTSGTHNPSSEGFLL